MDDYNLEVVRLSQLRAEAAVCTRCDLYARATQTVFGEGQRGARVLLVGEQPGDQEDRQGKPFVGPAGRLLDQAVRPEVIVCLGATAAQALLGRSFRVTKERGRPQPSPLSRWVLATLHPI